MMQVIICFISLKIKVNLRYIESYEALLFLFPNPIVAYNSKANRFVSTYYMETQISGKTST